MLALRLVTRCKFTASYQLFGGTRLALKAKGACSCETPVRTYKSTRRDTQKFNFHVFTALRISNIIKNHIQLHLYSMHRFMASDTVRYCWNTDSHFVNTSQY